MTDKRLFVRWDCNLQKFMYYVNLNDWELLE